MYEKTLTFVFVFRPKMNVRFRFRFVFGRELHFCRHFRLRPNMKNAFPSASSIHHKKVLVFRCKVLVLNTRLGLGLGLGLEKSLDYITVITVGVSTYTEHSFLPWRKYGGVLLTDRNRRVFCSAINGLCEKLLLLVYVADLLIELTYAHFAPAAVVHSELGNAINCTWNRNRK